MLQSTTIFADDMGDMKRLALALGAFGVVCFGALAGGAAHAQVQPSPPPVRAYPPGSTLTLEADPGVVRPNTEFRAELIGCFPGETVFFVNFRPYQTRQAVCDRVTFSASVTFTSSTITGPRNILAYMLARNFDDPDVPDYPLRVITAPYRVQTTIVISALGGAGEGGSGTSISSTSTSDGWFPDFVSWSGIVRTFLGLLGLLAAFFFVVLWRRRRDDEQQVGPSPGRAFPPPDSSAPSLA